MQVTTQVAEKENNWLMTAGLGFGLLVCLLLFGLVIARMGLLNGLFDGGETAVAAPNSFTLASENMRFAQSNIRVQAGQPITLQLHNKDMYGHSFDIDELDWHVQMPANDQTMVDFTAVAPGTYTIYCAVPGHREAGMVATLIVED